MNVLIIPEDFRKDQYILKPLFTKLFQRLGVHQVQVNICVDPLLGGIGEALKLERIVEIVEQEAPMRDILILCVDRDGEVGRRQRLDNIEAAIQAQFDDRVRFLAENAWEEIEAWVLAGLDLPSEWRWQEVRAAINVKEEYFEPLIIRRGMRIDSSHIGWKTFGAEASRRINAIRRKCPEDFDALALRLAPMAHSL